MTLHHDDILVICDDFWDSPKRVRHKMPLAWAKAGNRVLWIEKPPNPRVDWPRPGVLRDALTGRLQSVSERLWIGAAPPAPPGLVRGGAWGNGLRALYRPFFIRRIRHYMERLDFRPRFVVLFQASAHWDLFRRFPEAAPIYYCCDLIGYGHATPAMEREEERCCRAAAVVFATSERLRQRLTPFNPETYHVPHAVDAEWWDSNCDREPPAYRSIPRPRCVFTGVIGEGVDLALIETLATARPEVQWVLAGPIQRPAADHAPLQRIAARSNVHLLGPQPVEALAGFEAGADFLMLPYVLDANRAAAGLAVKFYEYFMSGKPVVATPYTDFEIEYKSLLHIGRDVDEWLRIVDSLILQAGDGAAAARERQELARRNTYTHRIELQRAILDRWLKEKKR